METHDPRVAGAASDMSFPVARRRQAPLHAPEEERAQLSRLSSALQASLEHDDSSYRLLGPKGETLEVPHEVLPILARVTAILERGESVSILAVHKELTTQQAADLLNLSRQYLVRLLDDGRIPHTRTGKHRRLRMEDVLAFQELRARQRRESLDPTRVDPNREPTLGPSLDDGEPGR
jgi:excisionase family DNA binding protein